jgi:tetratricopeptide (TPR) repeat protein
VEAWGQAELLFGRLCAGPAPPPEYLDNLARSRNNLGSSLHHLGRLEEAANALARAVPLQRRLTDVVPANPEFRRALATSYHNLSLILYAQGRGPQAEVACRQALALLEALARQSPDDRTNRWRLATARDQLALTLGLQGQEAAARAECRQGLELRRQLAADPEATPEDRKDLALSLNNLANLVQDHPAQSGEAVLAYREARDLLAELTRQYPGTASYAHDLIRCRENLAHALIRRGLGPEAVAEFRLVVAYWEKAAAAEPGNAALALDNCGRWCDLGLMLRLSPKPEEALPCLDRAEAGLQRLPAGGPDSGRARVLDKVGRHAEAIPSWERALAANAQAD